MTFRYNLTGANRKKLANAIGDILQLPVVYGGTPSFSYVVGGCLIDKYGTLVLPTGTTRENAARIVNGLRERSYTADESDYEQIADIPESAPAAESTDGDNLVLEMPRTHLTDEALERLKKIVSSKESLIKKALGADRLPIFTDEHLIRFPWFTLTGADGEADAYGHFVSALCKMANQLTRVSATETQVENDKFAMRLFLIRLGFVGADYKSARKILLRNLTGNSSWKSGQRPTQGGGS
jgi:hypothetical protein